MAAPIRPPVWPPAPGNIQPGRADVRASAQKAFFEAAMAGKTIPAVSASQPSGPTASAAQAVRAVAATEARALEDKLPRPGSIVDIWV